VNGVRFNIVIRYKLPPKASSDVSLSSYRALAEFRHQIRLFLHFSEEAARQAGIEPQQHQLLLAIKGIPIGTQPTIGRIAERLQLRHHSAAELVNRLTEHDAIVRETNPDDGREVRLRLTRTGERLLLKLSIAHHNELEKAGPALRDALDAVLQLSRKKT